MGFYPASAGFFSPKILRSAAGDSGQEISQFSQNYKGCKAIYRVLLQIFAGVDQ